MNLDDAGIETPEMLLLESVVQQLCTDLGVKNDRSIVDVKLTPTAHSKAGQFFYAVMSAGVRQTGKSDQVDMEAYGVSVAVIMRVSNMLPDHKWGFYAAYKMLAPRCEQVKQSLSRNYDVISRVNDRLLTAGGNSIFHSPLIYEGMGRIAPAHSGIWAGGPDTHTGIMRTVQFGGAEL